MRRPPLSVFPLLLAVTSLGACEAREAPRVELEVVSDGSGVHPVTTDLGWTVSLSEARVAIADLRFTTAGEVHDRQPKRTGELLLGLMLGRAHAHPGHFQGGEVIGELPGDHILDPFAIEPSLGVATLIVGDYSAVDFELRRADELDGDDPLAGHSMWLAGTATRDTVEIAFTAAIDSPIGRELVGAPFEVTISDGDERVLGLRLLIEDPYEGDSVFDGLDFAALDAADGAIDGVVALIDPERAPAQAEALGDAYNLLRRTLQTHDHFDVIARDP